MRDVELLFFDGCPSWQHAWAALGRVLAETGCEAPVRLRDVTAMATEDLDGFAGSPTIRVDGLDLFGYRGPSVMACRRYTDHAGRGWPSDEELRTRLAALLENTDPRHESPPT